MLVILNDNQMSIGHNTGGLATYFAKIWAKNLHRAPRDRKNPWACSGRMGSGEENRRAHEGDGRTWHHVRGTWLALYRPPRRTRSAATGQHTQCNGRTHGTSIPAYPYREGQGLRTGRTRSDRVSRDQQIGTRQTCRDHRPCQTKPPKYQDVFGQWLCDLAGRDDRVVGITPAMCEGSGWCNTPKFPDRFFDVAIAEQHSVTLAAGMACDGSNPCSPSTRPFSSRVTTS